MWGLLEGILKGIGRVLVTALEVIVGLFARVGQSGHIPDEIIQQIKGSLDGDCTLTSASLDYWYSDGMGELSIEEIHGGVRALAVEAGVEFLEENLPVDTGQLVASVRGNLDSGGVAVVPVSSHGESLDAEADAFNAFMDLLSDERSGASGRGDVVLAEELYSFWVERRSGSFTAAALDAMRLAVGGVYVGVTFNFVVSVSWTADCVKTITVNKDGSEVEEEVMESTSGTHTGEVSALVHIPSDELFAFVHDPGTASGSSVVEVPKAILLWPDTYYVSEAYDAYSSL